MSLRRFLLFICMVSVCHNAVAAIQNLQLLHSKASDFAGAYFLNKFGHKYAADDIEISVNKLDKRLNLKPCDNNLTFSIKEAPHNLTHATIKAVCNASSQWSIYIPVRINIFADVVIAAHNLSRGDILERDNLDYQRVNLATAKRGFIERVDRIEGLELKRPLKHGDIVSLSSVKKPNIVSKGQEVIVEAQNGLLQVQTTAIALSAGHKGKQIKVKNTRSNRIIFAKVISPGKVRVASH